MKELEDEFVGRGEVKGFFFKCLLKSNKAYIYEVKSEGGIHYEVFERIENTQFDCVSYPKSNAFSVWAYTTADWAKALKKYEYYNNKIKKVKKGINELIYLKKKLIWLRKKNLTMKKLMMKNNEQI